MKFKTPLRGKHGSVWGTHILVPKKVSKSFLDKGIKRLICTLNDSIQLNSGLMPDGDGEYFITINKNVVKQLGVSIGDPLHIHLDEDVSKYGMPMPEEFQELLYQDPEVDIIFHKLTAGKQRTLLYMIGKPKGAETRMKKAIVIAEYLKDCQGKIDYKELNQAFKNYSAR